VRADEEGATSSSSTDRPNELPFQLQVRYTDLDGAKAMRVLTQAQPVTSDRKEAETRNNNNNNNNGNKNNGNYANIYKAHVVSKLMAAISLFVVLYNGL